MNEEKEKKLEAEDQIAARLRFELEQKHQAEAKELERKIRSEMQKAEEEGKIAAEKVQV